MESITVNGKQQPLDDCTKKTYLNFGKDSITYHTFMPQADCKETGRIERSYYAVKGDTLTITDTAEMGGQKFTSNLILIKKK